MFLLDEDIVLSNMDGTTYLPTTYDQLVSASFNAIAYRRERQEYVNPARSELDMRIDHDYAIANNRRTPGSVRSRGSNVPPRMSHLKGGSSPYSHYSGKGSEKGTSSNKGTTRNNGSGKGTSSDKGTTRNNCSGKGTSRTNDRVGLPDTITVVSQLGSESDEDAVTRRRDNLEETTMQPRGLVTMIPTDQPLHPTSAAAAVHHRTETRNFKIPEHREIAPGQDAPKYTGHVRDHPASEPGYYNTQHEDRAATIDPSVLDQHGVPRHQLPNRDATRISSIHPDLIDASVIRNDKTVRRNPIDSKLTWNGQDSTFPEFRRKFEAWMNMTGLHYMLDPQFFRNYTEYQITRGTGWDEARIYAPITTSVQFQYDIRVLYGAIASCIPTDVRGQRWISQFEQSSDGLMVWSQFLLEFNQDGNIALKISRLEEDLHCPYVRDTGGLGFLAYIDKIARTFNQLESLATKNNGHGLVTHYSDIQKINTLNNAFKGSPYASKVYDIFIRVRDNREVPFKFNYFTQELNSWYLHADIGHGKEAQRRATMATQDPFQNHNEDMLSECEVLINAVLGEARKQTGIYFDRADFRKLVDTDPDILERINKLRQDVRTILGPEKKFPPKDTETTKGVPKLPKQYLTTPTTKTNNMTAYIASLSDEDADDFTVASNEEILQSTEERQIMLSKLHSPDTLSLITMAANKLQAARDERHICMTRCDTSINMDTIDVLINTNVMVKANIAIQEGWNYNIVDGGADTTLLGEGWHFEHVYTNRLVNIVGFNEHTSRKKGLQIGTAVSVMHDIHGEPFLAVFHEAVLHTGSRNSLLSEGQLRNHGIVVDSTSRRYVGVDGLPGTQTITVPHADNTRVQLYQKQVFMICIHRYPTKDERATLRRVEFTSPLRWNPQEHFDSDDDSIPAFTSNQAFIQHSMVLGGGGRH
jgi:hypothetical protein